MRIFKIALNWIVFLLIPLWMPIIYFKRDYKKNSEMDLALRGEKWFWE